MSQRLGFMQGRLSPMVDGRIQAFPRDCWQEEFSLAERLGFNLMEWTLDQDRLYENPLLTETGQIKIRGLQDRHHIRIFSLTGDCFMQNPFWKSNGTAGAQLEKDFEAVARACSRVGITMMVLPLVDNGRLITSAHEDRLISVLQSYVPFLTQLKVQVVFESDFGPTQLARFIDRLDPELFGINYDIGNSASLGLSPDLEIAAYGHRILNVHIKDRIFNGTTVPLGTGNADFDMVFAALARANYKGNYILQTARALDDNHSGVLCAYRDMALNWIKTYGA